LIEFAFVSVAVVMMGDVLQLATFVVIDNGTVGSSDDADDADDEDLAIVYNDGALCESFECDDGMFSD
jgi:hypothetical protein